MEHLNISPFLGMRAAQATGWKRLLLKVFPLHAALALKSELYMTWVRLKTRNTPSKYKDSSELLINIGAGNRGKPEWVNVDAAPLKNVNCVYDCRKQLPFPDSCARGIFTEHFLEHLDYTEELPYFLSECQRVLKPGGIIRIIVPDGEAYLRAYTADGWTEISNLRDLDDEHYDRYTDCRYVTKMELINEVFRQAYSHKFAFDFETVEYLLRKYGFTDVVQQEYGTSLLPELCIDLDDRAHESLYVEGVKP